MGLKKTWILVAALLLQGCTLPNRIVRDVDQLNFEQVHVGDTSGDENIEKMSLQASFQTAPESVVSSLREAPSELEKHDMKALNVPMNSFLMACGSRYKTNISVDPSLTKPITMNLRQVTLKDVFEHISQFHEIDYERTRSGWLVKPAQMSTRLYTIDNINLVRWGHSSTSVPRASNTFTALSLTDTSAATPGSDAKTDDATVLATTFDNSKQWKELENILISLKQVPNQEYVTVNQSTGIISVQAFSKTHKLIDKFVRYMNFKLSQQVMIEAKILEVELFDNYQSGVNLTGTKFAYDSVKGQMKYYTSASSFNDIMTLMKTQGRVNTISSPKVAVAHQQRAVMKVGNDAYYATGTSSTQSVDSSVSQVNNLVAYQAFFSGLVLDVTPHVNDKNEISMHVHPYISAVTPDLLNMPLQNTVTGDLITNSFLRMAATQIRETDTIVRAKSGEVIVIAGLMARRYLNEHKSPGVNVTTGSADEYKNTEIVILIKPILMNSSKWKKMLANTRIRLDEWNESGV